MQMRLSSFRNTVRRSFFTERWKVLLCRCSLSTQTIESRSWNFVKWQTSSSSFPHVLSSVCCTGSTESAIVHLVSNFFNANCHFWSAKASELAFYFLNTTKQETCADAAAKVKPSGRCWLMESRDARSCCLRNPPLLVVAPQQSLQ